jgi:hypothetical protein
VSFEGVASFAINESQDVGLVVSFGFTDVVILVGLTPVFKSFEHGDDVELVVCFGFTDVVILVGLTPLFKSLEHCDDVGLVVCFGFTDFAIFVVLLPVFKSVEDCDDVGIKGRFSILYSLGLELCRFGLIKPTLSFPPIVDSHESRRDIRYRIMSAVTS